MTEPAPEWTVVREGDLTLTDHEAIATMLAQAFPDWDHWYVGGRSWSGMQPERRVIATVDDVVVAHVGIRRMFVTVGGRDQLVGAVGLVGVTPRLQGRGLGGELLARTAAVLDELAVPFGLLGTGEDRVPFYGSAGWRLLSDTAGWYSAFTADGAGLTVVDDEGWLVLPVRATLEDWPGGELHWDAQLV
ncbi:GNAT family N-acetyltransferase [Curtobacterium sp. MCBD17_034]|uniref:GNAT family N-acetyltransferase n=1 Tax=unclassified Curtobacterium TaxID=257496 RepID=UPI000DA812C8|nr:MULTISPECIES: GNAT family N-acetyltransferase [unclassified Curtobacterium]PZF62531.1 GNAT family N-acetyltransferase [Curtobacterium sp. MCBD17_034]PZM39762.1 GNAT family N-acetyltransferase [Curtobacterium sp. MCBD17_031]